MSVDIPTTILKALEPYESGCWSLESHGDTAFVVKLPEENLEVAWHAKLLIRLDLAMDVAPCVARLKVEVRGERAPASLAVLWNGADERQFADLKRLASQGQIDFYFYDRNSDYQFTRRLVLPAGEARRFQTVVDLIGQYLASLPHPVRQGERARVQSLLEEED